MPDEVKWSGWMQILRFFTMRLESDVEGEEEPEVEFRTLTEIVRSQRQISSPELPDLRTSVWAVEVSPNNFMEFESFEDAVRCLQQHRLEYGPAVVGDLVSFARSVAQAHDLGILIHENSPLFRSWDTMRPYYPIFLEGTRLHFNCLQSGVLAEDGTPDTSRIWSYQIDYWDLTLESQRGISFWELGRPTP